MRILQIHNEYRLRGGEDVQVEMEAEALRGVGHEVVRVTARNPDPAIPSAIALAKAPHNGRAARSALRAALVDPPDVAHVHNTWFQLSPAAFEVLSERGVPTVMTLHNYRLVCMQAFLLRDGRICTECVGSSPLSGVRYRCYRDSLVPSAAAAATIALTRMRKSLRGVARMIVPSATMQDVFVAAGIEAERIRVVANMVSDPGPRPARPSASRKVLFVGRLSKEKGVDTLIEAWAGLPGGIGLQLEVVGEGPMHEELGRRLPAGVELSGLRSGEQVNEAMLGARALIFPTRGMEPFGRVAVEAFAAGLPVLGARIGGAEEIVAKLGSEWLFSPGDPHGLRGAIEELVADDDAVDGTGALARQTYERSYAPEASLEQLEAIYREAASAGARDPSA